MKIIAPSVASVLAVFAALGLSVQAASAQVIDVLGALPASDFSTYIAPQSYRDWGNEPFVSVNPLDPQQIVVSSFAYGSWISDGTAQLWYSTNGGVNWGIRFSVPAPFANDTFFVDDQTYAYDSSGVLHCAMLVLDNSRNIYVYHGMTTNVNTSAAWSWTGTAFSAFSPDQPWLALGGSTVAVAYDDFGAAHGVEQRVALSTNNGAAFPPALNQAVGSPGGAPNSTGGSPLNYINPGLRVAVDNLGDVFIIFGMATNGVSGVPLMHYRLNRYSGGAAWDFTSASGDILGGLEITNGLSRQGSTNSFWFAGEENALLGNITSIAVNTNGNAVYLAYGLTDSNGVGRLFLQRFQPNGTNLAASGNPLAVSSSNFSAALPSLAVAANGGVGLMFDEFDGTNIHIHLAISFDLGQTIHTNIELYSFSTNGMVLGYGTVNHNRLLGDYQGLHAQSNTFYGTFAGRGNVNAGSIITTNFIDPFFFALTALGQRIRPILSQPAKGGGVFQFTLAGEAGVSYVIQASTDLKSWTPVATNTGPTTSRLITVNTTNSQNYYRALVGP